MDNESGLILGSTQVTGSENTWTYSPLANGSIQVRQGSIYTVAARMGTDSSGRAIWGISLPFTQSEVSVNSAVQGWSEYPDPAAWVASIRAIPDQNTKGLLDIDFEPDTDTGTANCLTSRPSYLQSVTASQSGCVVHESIDDRLADNNIGDYWADFAGVQGTLSAACEDLHDQFWVTGPDSDVYARWHPAAAVHTSTWEGCVFGHEHGDDPSMSPVFDFSGGWPPFGHVDKTKASDRVEDHFGHKITLATYRAGIGNHPQDTASEGVAPPAIHDAGFDCHWLSKLHQGSYSLDAYPNHLHR